jgi:catechol 2,3-dioxygenase-like lactoylglutathione lyase family enzyme
LQNLCRPELTVDETQNFFAAELHAKPNGSSVVICEGRPRAKILSVKMPKNIDVLFVAGFGPIVRDPAASRKFYSETLGLPFKEDSGGYLHTGGLDGVKHFALWPLAQAAESCFGTDLWPGNLPAPQAWIEFDVGNIEKATAELEAQGYKLLVAIRKEPWGQTVTRLLGPEGLLVGISHTPPMRK